jgi:serpin B
MAGFLVRLAACTSQYLLSLSISLYNRVTLTRQSLKYIGLTLAGAVALFAGIFLYLIGYPTHNPIQSPQLQSAGHCSTTNATSTQSNDQFAFDILSCYEQQSENVLFSPYGLKTALAMIAEGANGETRNEILRTLHITSNYENQTGPITSSIAQDFENGSDDLKITNHIWVQNDFPIKQDFVRHLDNYYQGGVTTLDFNNAKDASHLVNEWIAKETNGEITNLLPQASITPLTRLIVTDAILFSGKWLVPFEINDTHSEDFELPSGGKISVPMMSLTGERAIFDYTENNEIQAIELPYADNQYSMLILLPKTLNLNNTLEMLTPSALASLRSSMVRQRVNLHMPRFGMQMEYSMADQLRQLGTSLAFSEHADFSNVSELQGLHLNGIYQQAVLQVDEGGTKAVAGTAVNMDTLGFDPQPIPNFRADHPFLFLIQNNRGDILFIGKLMNPKAN